MVNVFNNQNVCVMLMEFKDQMGSLTSRTVKDAHVTKDASLAVDHLARNVITMDTKKRFRFNVLLCVQKAQHTSQLYKKKMKHVVEYARR
jgi:hypothetical protein